MTTPISFHTPTLNLAGWTTGPSPEVVALHGWLDNANTWKALAPHLPALVSLDLPGHGLSQHKQGPYNIWDTMADLLAVVESMGSPICLMGHSMGAGIATLFAGCFPEHVKGLALVEGFGPWLEPTLSAQGQLRRAAQAAVAGHKPSRPFASVELAANIRAKHGVTPVSAEAIMPVVQRALVERADGFHWRHDPYLVQPSALRMTSEQVDSVLDKIRCPVRIVLGRDGLLSGSDVLKARLQTCKADVLWLEGDHHLHLYPENVDAISEFLTPVLK